MRFIDLDSWTNNKTIDFILREIKNNSFKTLIENIKKEVSLNDNQINDI